MTKLRFTLAFLALLFTAGVLVVASGQTSGERAAVQAQRLTDIDRRITEMEGLKLGEKVATLETRITEARYYQETSRNLMYGLYVPVCLLALGKVLDFLDKQKR